MSSQNGTCLCVRGLTVSVTEVNLHEVFVDQLTKLTSS